MRLSGLEWQERMLCRIIKKLEEDGGFSREIPPGLEVAV